MMTVAAWPGTDFRLWAASLAKSIWRQGLQMPPITAAADDASGHLIATTQLGTR